MARKRGFTKRQQQWYYEADLAHSRIKSFALKNPGVEIPDLIGSRPERVTEKELNRLRDISPAKWETDNGRLVLSESILNTLQKRKETAAQETDVILSEIDRTLITMKNESAANERYAKHIRQAIKDAIKQKGAKEVARVAKEQNLLEETRIIMAYSDIDKKRKRLAGFINALMGNTLSAQDYSKYMDEIAEAQEDDEGTDYETTVSDSRRGYLLEFSVERQARKYLIKNDERARKILSQFSVSKNDSRYSEAYHAILEVLMETNGNIEAAEEEAERYLGEWNDQS